MPMKEMRLFPFGMGEGEYVAAGGPPFQGRVWGPLVVFLSFVVAHWLQANPLRRAFLRGNKKGSSPANGLEPPFLTLAPSNYRFD
jgi:hypothetical protein